MTRKHGFSILSVVESFVFKLSRLTLIAQALLRASTNIFALEGLAIMVKETQTKGQLRRLFYTCFAFTELRKIKMITRVMNARIRVTQVVPLRSLSAVDPAQSLPTLRGSIQTRIQIQSVPNLGKKMQLLIRPGKKTKKYQVQKYWTRSSLLTFSMLLYCSIKKLHGIPRVTSKRSDWRLLRVDYFILQLAIWLDDPNQAFDGTCDKARTLGQIL